MRPVKDAEHSDLREVLESLIANDVDVTVREVARRHPTLKNASAFTRSEARVALIEQARQRQQDARKVRAGPEAEKALTLSEALEQRTQRVEQLELQVKQLVASHAACVRAVMMHGGMASLERFWAEYKAIGEGMKALGAVPQPADVVPLARPGRPIRGRTSGG
jgi:hypothetical protein